MMDNSNFNLEGFLPRTKIMAGPGCSPALCEWLQPCAERGDLVIVHGHGMPDRNDAPAALLKRLRKEFPRVVALPVEGEPSDLWVDRARSKLQGAGAKVGGVVSIGGGSALDAGKALAALLTEAEPAARYLEGIGDLKPEGTMLPWFAVPTTAGTGSEASTNSVLSRPGPGGFKKSLRHDHYHAAGIILDPEHLLRAPAPVLAASGLDAFTQLLESWSSRRVEAALEVALAHFLQQMFRALPAVLDGEDRRDEQEILCLQWGALWSGIGLTRAGLGTTHGLAGTVGALINVPHGVACARIMGPAWRETIDWLVTNAGQDEQTRTAWTKVQNLESQLGPHAWAAVQSWAQKYKIPPLRRFGLGEEELQIIVSKGSDRDSPARLGPARWEKILREAAG